MKIFLAIPWPGCLQCALAGLAVLPYSAWLLLVLCVQCLCCSVCSDRQAALLGFTLCVTWNVSVGKTECPVSLIVSSCKPCSNGYLLWPWNWLILSERFFPHGAALSERFLHRTAAQNRWVWSAKFHEQFFRAWLWWCPALVHWTPHFIEMDWGAVTRWLK